MLQDHPPVKFGKTGLLFINLGTPDSTNWFDIRKYLKEFLSDRRVIEVNPIIWQIILNLFILTFRPSKTAKAYKEIWMKDVNKSPLLYYTEKQMEKTSNYFKDENLIIVDYKSGKAPSTKYKEQRFFAMKLYALLIKNELGIMPKELKLIYLQKQANLYYIKNYKIS